jgi:hypothetical protein
MQQPWYIVLMVLVILSPVVENKTTDISGYVDGIVKYFHLQ